MKDHRVYPLPKAGNIDGDLLIIRLHAVSSSGNNRPGSGVDNLNIRPGYLTQVQPFASDVDLSSGRIGEYPDEIRIDGHTIRSQELIGINRYFGLKGQCGLIDQRTIRGRDLTFE